MDKKEKKNKAKRITVWSLALMGFTCVWGFANATNGFGYFGGTRVIVPWILVFVLYFAPYALMVGELGSIFKDKAGGVSSWIKETVGPSLAFLCGWIYWVVHTPYMSQKPNNMIIAGNWLFFQNGNTSDNITNLVYEFLTKMGIDSFDVTNFLNAFPNISVIIVQLIGLVIFLVCVLLSTRGINIVKIISSIAGTASLVMGLLFILMVFAAPAINPNANMIPISLDLLDYIPSDMSAMLNLSILIFAIGGIEKLSPYVNQMKNGKREFPASMVVVMVMVMVCAFLGTIAMGMMFDINNIPDDFLTNGQYMAFGMLGEYYHVGNFFVGIYALTTIILNFAVLIISLDAPLRILLGNADRKFIPNALLKTNKHGAYTRGILMESIIVIALIILPCIGIGNIDELVKWLIKLNSVCMPLRYLFVFTAYIGLKVAYKKFKNDGYMFVKNRYFGIFVGGWCFVITFACCVMGMYSTDPFQLIANVATPIVLLALGFILPLVANRKKLLHK